MTGPSENHRMLAELAMLYCRVKWSIWPCAVEAVGLDKRNYDAIGLRSSPRGILGFEVKVTRGDFKKGLTKGHFNKNPYITELWLVYPGTFSVAELPDYVGVLKPRSKPICIHHEREGRICNEKCPRKKNVFLEVVRDSKCFGDKTYERDTFAKYAAQWAWKIATSNATKFINLIEANTVYDWGTESNDPGDREIGPS